MTTEIDFEALQATLDAALRGPEEALLEIGAVDFDRLQATLDASLAGLPTSPEGFVAGPEGFTVGAAGTSDVPLIRSTGSGEVRVKSDSAHVSLAVEVQDKTLEAAQTQVSQRIAAVIAALKAIPGAEVETSRLSFAPIYDHKDRLLSFGQNLKPIGYRARNGVVATFRAAVDEVSAKASQAVDRGMAAGASEVNGISFYLDDKGPAKREALAKAVQAAKADAEAMAAAAGVKITGLHNLDQSTGSWYDFSDDMPAMAMASVSRSMKSATPVEAGETVVRARVVASYTFEAA